MAFLKPPADGHFDLDQRLLSSKQDPKRAKVPYRLVILGTRALLKFKLQVAKVTTATGIKISNHPHIHRAKSAGADGIARVSRVTHAT